MSVSWVHAVRDAPHGPTVLIPAAQGKVGGGCDQEDAGQERLGDGALDGVVGGPADAGGDKRGNQKSVERSDADGAERGRREKTKQ